MGIKERKFEREREREKKTLLCNHLQLKQTLMLQNTMQQTKKPCFLCSLRDSLSNKTTIIIIIVIIKFLERFRQPI